MDQQLDRLQSVLRERYTIESRAGQGGMALVFRATDLKHKRQVAIKVLRPELAATVGSDRFLQEIEVSARLQHPHIVPLYDSGDAGGILYYVMPFIAGESLRDRLTREGRIPFEEAVALTREVASALAYAHAQGVVHRDIKPENIMLSGGHAMVTDFGIARALRAAATGQQLTGLGFAIGTPAYMSPEQATASDVDGRSDQYALGCVFYEMVSGAAPFAGSTVQAVLSQSLTGPRPRLSKVTRTTPPEADAPVQRALSADPGARYPSMQEFAAALERAAGGGTGAVAERRRLRRIAIWLPLAVTLAAAGWIMFGPRPTGPVMAGAETIAVFPFTATGPGVEALGEGMVNLLSTNLNAVGAIRAVEPRTILSRWEKAGGGRSGELETALAIARSVRAGAALLGSITATGSQVRLAADLYNQDGKSLAHAQVDGAADSVLPLVDSLSLALVRDIWRSKEPLPSLRVSALTTTSLGAMREFLAGERFYRRAAWDSAAAAFGRAIEADSTFAMAHYRLAMALGWRGGYGTPRAQQATAAALRFASRLPARERTLVEAYQLFSQGRLAAVDTMKRYVAAWPDDVEGWYLLGETQYHTRQLTGLPPAELEQPFDRVLALDSSLTPALIHPLEITLASRDSGGFYRYLGSLERFADPEEARAFAANGAVVWQGKTPDSTEIRLMAQQSGALLATLVAAHTGRDASSAKVLAALSLVARAVNSNPSRPSGDNFSAVRAMMLSTLGRFAEAERLADTLKSASAGQTSGLLLFPHMLGIAPPDFAKEIVDSALQRPIQSPTQAFVQSLVLLSRGDGPRAGHIIDSMLRSDTTHLPSLLRGGFRAASGWRTLLAGDTTRGIRELREGIQAMPAGNSFFGAPVRMELATALAARPETRDEGLRLLRYGFENDIGVLPVAYYALGRAADAAGRRDDAIFGYGQFIRLWDRADPVGQARVREAKEALARLMAEPQG